MKQMSSGTSSNFTLIELLVVIAIIGILMSMLLPSLMKAKKTSETAVCINNQSQLYKAGMHYADANEGHIVPATGVGSYAISFDDLIGEYMNRDLTQAEIDKEYNYKNVSALQCPSSTIEPAEDWRTGKAGSVRSYAMNSGWQWGVAGPKGFDGITSVKTGDSSVIWQLTDTSNLLYSGETHMPKAAVGYGGHAAMMGMGSKYVGDPIHPGLRSVYVLVDGHAEQMLPDFAKTKSRRANR